MERWWKEGRWDNVTVLSGFEVSLGQIELERGVFMLL